MVRDGEEPRRASARAPTRSHPSLGLSASTTRPPSAAVEALSHSDDAAGNLQTDVRVQKEQPLRDYIPTDDKTSEAGREDEVSEADAEAGADEASTIPAPRPRPQKIPKRRPGAVMGCSLGATLAALASAAFIHYYIHADAVSAATPPTPLKMPGLMGPFDVELEKAELCEKEKQGVGAARMDWGSLTKDKDVPKRYHISGRGSFNYNVSDDLASKFLLASWGFPGRWVTYYSNTFTGGCSMAKNFSPDKWRRVSMLVFGHENADCPFPPIRVEVTNFTVENRQHLVKEFIYGRWKVENQIIDVASGNRVVSCGRAIFRIVPKQKERPSPVAPPPYDNSDKFSVEPLEPADAPP